MFIILMRVYVGHRRTWRTPRHPWRLDGSFNLKGIPTSIRWENDAIKGRLEDHEAHLKS
ncbi:Thioredoxin-like protein Clot [Capsicum annuum]|uniref:Thioredoxin-like protein Clot n=1 Tax=Capsicum annuum TaxID=4072 RepID=A0A2G2Z2Z9_CAPAN|nr:Thioredoxin-like protein Clot [Capsicum annuum]